MKRRRRVMWGFTSQRKSFQSSSLKGSGRLEQKLVDALSLVGTDFIYEWKTNRSREDLIFYMYSLYFEFKLYFQCSGCHFYCFLLTLLHRQGELLDPVGKIRSSRHPSRQLVLAVEATCHECSVCILTCILNDSDWGGLCIFTTIVMGWTFITRSSFQNSFICFYLKL